MSTSKSHKSKREFVMDSASGPSSAQSTKTEPTLHPVTGSGQDMSIFEPTEGDPKKQYWFREPGSKTRKLFNQILVMRMAGREDRDIAKKLKTTEANVRQTVYIGRKNGWMDEDGEPVDLEAELAVNIDRKIVRNIAHTLDGGLVNWQTHEMTIAAAKGRRIFKSESAPSDTAQLPPIVAIQVIMPTIGAGDQMPEIGDDQMGGVPAYLDAEVVDGRPNNVQALPEGSAVTSEAGAGDAAGVGVGTELSDSQG